jgi:hypothetical protein
MEEGRHYFRGCGEFVRTSSGRGDDVLLTERGYLVLVKTFHDPLAWKVQEDLVEGYFRARAAPAPESVALQRYDGFMVKMEGGLAQMDEGSFTHGNHRFFLGSSHQGNRESRRSN